MSDNALKVGETSTVTITFSEAVSSFDNTDISVENGTLTNGHQFSDGGVTWTGTFTPTDDIEDATNRDQHRHRLDRPRSGNAPLTGRQHAPTTRSTPKNR